MCRNNASTNSRPIKRCMSRCRRSTISSLAESHAKYDAAAWMQEVMRVPKILRTGMGPQLVLDKANEHAAVAQARLHMFVLAQGGLTALETAQIVVRAYPAIVRRAQRDTPPAFYSITRSGEVQPLKLIG